MKKVRVLILTIFLLCVEAYLIENVFPALIAFAIAIYILYISLEFNPKLEIERKTYGSVLYEGRKEKLGLIVRNFTNKIYKARLFEEPDFIVDKTGFIINSGENEFNYFIIPVKGVYNLKGRLEVWDSRELFNEIFRIEELKIEVIPSVESLKEESKFRANLSSARSIFGIPVDLHFLREFQSGDDTRRIEWKASARLGELIVKDFLKEWEGDIYIVFDSSREMRKKLDFSLRLVYDILHSLRGKRIGLIIYDEVGVKKILKAENDISIIIRNLKITPLSESLSLKIPDLRISRTLRSFLKKIPSYSLSLINQIPRKSFLIFISDLSTPDELFRVLFEVKKDCKVILISPNPVLLYKGKITKENILKLYRAYSEREKLIRKINLIVPTIDVGERDLPMEVRT